MRAYRCGMHPDAAAGIAEWNPVSAVTQAARELFGNIPPAPDSSPVAASEPGHLHPDLGGSDYRHLHTLAIRKYTTMGSGR
jgi:hypothetical protein